MRRRVSVPPLQPHWGRVAAGIGQHSREVLVGRGDPRSHQPLLPALTSRARRSWASAAPSWHSNASLRLRDSDIRHRHRSPSSAGHAPIAGVASQDFADIAARLGEAWDGSRPFHDRWAGIVCGERQGKPVVESVEQLSQVPASAAHRLSWVHRIPYAERLGCFGCQLHKPVGAAARVVSSRVERGLFGDHGRHQRRRQPAVRRGLPDDVCIGPCVPSSDAGLLPIAGAADSERDRDQWQRDNSAGPR